MESQRNKTIQLTQEIRLYLQSLKEPIDADFEEASHFRKKLHRALPPKSEPPSLPAEISVAPPPFVEPTPPPSPPKIQAPLVKEIPPPLPANPKGLSKNKMNQFDSARQSQIEGFRSEREVLSPCGKDDEEDRFGKVVASQNGSGYCLTVPKPLPIEPPPLRLPSLAPPSIEIKPLPFQKLKALLQKIAPSTPILSEPPSDAFAKKIHTRWKTKNQIAPITLLSFQEPPEQKALLQEIVKALDVYFGPARLVEAGPIEKEQQWEALLSVPELRWILCCDYTLWQLPKLLALFKEIPAQQLKTIGSKPLFLFPDLSLYLKDPLLKRSLWKALETALGKEL